MRISFDKFECHGEVIIQLEIIQDTASITLNAAENLKIGEDRICLKIEGSDEVYKPSAVRDKNAETLTVTLDETLSAGKRAILTLEFDNKISDEPKGLYRSPFTNSQGQTEYILTTQFEPTYARRAFPCFDDPALRAKFKVNLKTHENLTCLSNTHGKQLDDKSFEFNQTPPMSTYLLAFVKASIFYVLDHEIVHQWLGNFVTWASWKDWWLKEGLATLLANERCAQLFQELGITEFSYPFGVAPDLRYGIPDWTHPVKVPVASPHEFYKNVTFDLYWRSQYILSGVQTYVTPQKFRQGIRNIIAKYGLGTVCAHQFWEALEQLGCAKVGYAADFWAETGGYCVVEVTEDDIKGTIRVKQRPFYRTASKIEDRVIGPLFMTIQTTNGVQSHLIDGIADHEYHVDLSFYKLNVNNVAPYYNLYTEKRLLELAQYGEGLIDENGMLGLIAETTVLTDAGYQNSRTLSLLKKAYCQFDESVIEMGNESLQDF
ncbi:hypothetical protein H9Q70_014327 [Fusarium xylarioides]|nr:hypothetical protein H9Q70_014327 [Fusarium xylarioides]KAG5767539.1 hypothetical protein H9Q73_014146 [Fusarium xylarioides]